MLTEKY